MKWFKHDTKAHTDEKIRELILECGLEGYGFYMMILELVAEKLDEKRVPEIEISVRLLAEKARMKRATVTRLLARCSAATLFVTSYTDLKVRINCPNLLHHLDNHTSYYKVTSKQLTSESDQESDKNKMIERRSPTFSFSDEQMTELKTEIAKTMGHSVFSEANKESTEHVLEKVKKSARRRKIENPFGYALTVAKNLMKPPPVKV